jgi:hypothetical protein
MSVPSISHPVDSELVARSRRDIGTAGHVPGPGRGGGECAKRRSTAWPKLPKRSNRWAATTPTFCDTAGARGRTCGGAGSWTCAVARGDLCACSIDAVPGAPRSADGGACDRSSISRSLHALGCQRRKEDSRASRARGGFRRSQKLKEIRLHTGRRGAVQQLLNDRARFGAGIQKHPGRRFGHVALKALSRRD